MHILFLHRGQSIGGQFTSEIKIHKSLTHRQIVQFEHFFEDADNAYILLELCRNQVRAHVGSFASSQSGQRVINWYRHCYVLDINHQSLSDLLRRRKKISEAEVRFYIRQVVDGIAYLHANLVIHRDLKLGNLLLTSDMEVKIGDFGLATRLDTLYDRKRTMCGTPNYIAPEILNGQRGDGHSFEVDIWSLGVVMYTLLVGRPPFETEDVKDTYKRIRANQFGFPEDTDVSESAQSLIRSILRGEPHLRPSLKAILAHPFLQDEFVPATLSRTALLITPPDCKRKVFLPERDRTSIAEPPLRSTHVLPLAPPRRHPLRSRDVNVRGSSSGGGEQQVADENRVPTPSSSSKAEAGRRDGATTPSSALKSGRPTTATDSTPASTSTLRRSEERQAAVQDPLETIYATLTRLFALEDGSGHDEPPLSAHSSASSVVAAAKRLREIRAETETLPPAAPATLWVSQWVDYTSKYGMGYMLSNGSAGVYFNDSTKVVATRDDAFFEYLERTSEAANATEQRVRYAAGEHDAALTKKVTLLKHFKSYLVDGRGEREEADVLERQLTRLSDRELLPSADANRPMVYVSKWVKTRHAMLFCLSNDTFQINFFDASKLLLSSGGRTASYVDKEGVLAAFSTALVVLRNERPDLLKRLRYAKDMLQQMARTQSAASA